MPRVVLYMVILSSLAWGGTALLASHWWESPAFGRTGLPLWAHAGLWMVACVISLATLLKIPLSPATVVLGLVLYALSTSLMGSSIVWFTIKNDVVSAMGSAIAWLTLGLAGFYLAISIMKQAHDAGSKD